MTPYLKQFSIEIFNNKIKLIKLIIKQLTIYKWRYIDRFWFKKKDDIIDHKN